MNATFTLTELELNADISYHTPPPLNVIATIKRNRVDRSISHAHIHIRMPSAATLQPRATDFFPPFIDRLLRCPTAIETVAAAAPAVARLWPAPLGVVQCSFVRHVETFENHKIRLMCMKLSEYACEVYISACIVSSTT